MKGLTASSFFALLLTAGCGSAQAPAAPTPPATTPATLGVDVATAGDFQGRWEGIWTVESSTTRGGKLGVQRQFSVRLQNVGGRLDGYLISYDALGGTVLTGTVAGTVQADHRLTLDGVVPRAGTNDLSLTWHASLWFSLGAMQGTLSYDAQLANVPYGDRTAGTIIAATRTPDPPNDFSGTWRGRTLVRSCDMVVWPMCYGGYVGETQSLELVLSQFGTAVTGTIDPDYSKDATIHYLIPVSGQVSGGTLQLSGTSLAYPYNPRATRRLLTFSATRDAVGRLTGSFVWQDDWDSSGANFGSLHRLTRANDLYIVVQVQ